MARPPRHPASAPAVSRSGDGCCASGSDRRARRRMPTRSRDRPSVRGALLALWLFRRLNKLVNGPRRRPCWPTRVPLARAVLPDALRPEPRSTPLALARVGRPQAGRQRPSRGGPFTAASVEMIAERPWPRRPRTTGRPAPRRRHPRPGFLSQGPVAVPAPVGGLADRDEPASARGPRTGLPRRADAHLAHGAEGRPEPGRPGQARPDRRLSRPEASIPDPPPLAARPDPEREPAPEDDPSDPAGRPPATVVTRSPPPRSPASPRPRSTRERPAGSRSSEPGWSS